MRFAIAILGVLFLSSAPALSGQTQTYEPDYETPVGRELIGVFISSHTCGGGQAAELKEAVEELKFVLSERAREAGVNFRMIGVIVSWEVEESLEYLAEFGAFDEVVVGSNWFNVGAQHYLWADSTKKTVIPQVQVIEHEVRPSERRLDIGPPLTLIQVLGSEEIIQWVGEGAPVPEFGQASGR